MAGCQPWTRLRETFGWRNKPRLWLLTRDQRQSKILPCIFSKGELPRHTFQAMDVLIVILSRVIRQQTGPRTIHPFQYLGLSGRIGFSYRGISKTRTVLILCIDSGHRALSEAYSRVDHLGLYGQVDRNALSHITMTLHLRHRLLSIPKLGRYIRHDKSRKSSRFWLGRVVN